MTLLRQLPALSDLDRKVLQVASEDVTHLFDSYGYPTNEAVERVTRHVGLDPEDECVLRDIYYRLKFLKPYLEGYMAERKN